MGRIINYFKASRLCGTITAYVVELFLSIRAPKLSRSNYAHLDLLKWKSPNVLLWLQEKKNHE